MPLFFNFLFVLKLVSPIALFEDSLEKAIYISIKDSSSILPLNFVTVGCLPEHTAYS